MTNAHENEPAVITVEASFPDTSCAQLSRGLADIASVLAKQTKQDPYALLRAAAREIEQREALRATRHARNVRRWRIPA